MAASESTARRLSTQDVVLGHASVGRSTETPRSLRLCEAEGGELVHSLDAPCAGKTLEHLGFVH